MWVELTFEWNEDAMVFHVLHFSLFVSNQTAKKENVDDNNFLYCYGNFFETAVLKVNWSQLRLKFFLNNYEEHWQQNLEVTYSWRFYGHGSTCVLILSWLNIMKRQLTKVPGKLSVAKKFKPFEENYTKNRRWHFTSYFIPFSLKNT